MLGHLRQLAYNPDTTYTGTTSGGTPLASAPAYISPANLCIQVDTSPTSEDLCLVLVSAASKDLDFSGVDGPTELLGEPSLDSESFRRPTSDLARSASEILLAALMATSASAAPRAGLLDSAFPIALFNSSCWVS